MYRFLCEHKSYFSGIMLRSIISESQVSCIFTFFLLQFFKSITKLFSRTVLKFYILHQKKKSDPCSPHPCQYMVLLPFKKISHSDRYCSFNLYFPCGKWRFPCVLVCFISVFDEMSLHVAYVQLVFSQLICEDFLFI